MTTLKAGQVVVLTDGYYEDEQVVGCFRILKEFDLEAEFNRWRDVNCRRHEEPSRYSAHRTTRYQGITSNVSFHEYLMVEGMVTSQEHNIVNIGDEFNRDITIFPTREIN